MSMISEMSAQKPSRLAVTGLLAYLYAPLVGVLAVTGYAFGWRPPVALLAGTGVIVTKFKVDLRRRRSGAKPIAWQLQMLALVVLGTAIGGLLLGAAGFVCGLVIGLSLGLPPVSVKNKDGIVAPLDPTDRVQAGNVNRTLGIFMGAVPAAFAIVFVVGLLVERFA
jgi:hypothetical protein